MKGVYVLFLRVPFSLSMMVGGLGKVEFEAGCYAYVGSAMGGIEQRVGRHFAREKKLYWHIDHLLLRATPYDLLAAECRERKECELARRLSQRLPCVRGFGCTDCGCESHLFYSPDPSSLLHAVLEAFQGAGLKPRRLRVA